MNRPAQISYVLFALVMALVAWLHLGTFLLSLLLGYLALQIFCIRCNKALSVAFYVVTVIVVGAGMLYFASLVYRTLPRLAENAIPAMVQFAEDNGVDLPFTDYASLKSSALAQAREGIALIGRYARIASFQTVLLVAGLVVALGMFLNPSWKTKGHGSESAESVYSQVTREITIRFSNLFRSFAIVMNAQIGISAINTALTAMFLFACGYQSPVLLLCLVFLCGLIPIAGNLISNAVIVGVGFTMSPKTGILALIFLVVIHKLEYLLDSKIIGRRIHSPVWLTLIGLLVGERVMGLPGMILAPVLLHYIRTEASTYQFRVRGPALDAEDRSIRISRMRIGRVPSTTTPR